MVITPCIKRNRVHINRSPISNFKYMHLLENCFWKRTTMLGTYKNVVQWLSFKSPKLEFDCGFWEKSFT
jgi:hypothetical protein